VLETEETLSICPSEHFDLGIVRNTTGILLDVSIHWQSVGLLTSGYVNLDGNYLFNV